MVGYPESITDPSYYGQILIQTFPLIGNYGVNHYAFESDAPKVRGYIVRENCRTPSHWSSGMTLDEWLSKSGIPAIEGVDTRALTKKLRIHGVMLGILSVYETCDEPSIREIMEEVKCIPDPNCTDLARDVSVRKPVYYDAGGRYTVTLIDCGVKKSIIKNLLVRGLNVRQVPIDTSPEVILNEKPDGILISNGPGNPKTLSYLICTIRELAESGVPIFGICLGCQLLALALGGDTYKMKFGHRGQNHPIIDVKTGRCYITSQNHGFAIDRQSLPDELETVFINANDNTVEGIRHKRLPIFAVQHHPEASPGPNDTAFLFDIFVEKIRMEG